MSSLNKRQKLNDSNSNNTQPWVEKYRPKSLDDVYSQDHTVSVLKKNLQTSNLPHMLFYGPPGTGKTSTILAMTKELYGPNLINSRILELNASDERGINIVRKKIKNFAKLIISKPSKDDLEKYPCPPYKIIILDEADSMTSDAQSALRRTMEKYSNITRFCLICNYVTRIIDPLASRCTKFRFKSLNNDNAIERLKFISKNENLNVENDEINNDFYKNLLQIANGDLRRSITLLQSASNFSLDGPITSARIDELAGIVPDVVITNLVDKISNKNLNEIIEFTNNNIVKLGYSASAVILQLHDYYIINSNSDTKFKNNVSYLLFDIDSKLTNGSNENIQLITLLLNISQLY
ncbi:hypothetical protein TBLA_0B01950 [Henningerozyma blattae CBS 6284]|uniref:AAA+ ATPase domain-containing protein n=1 Tax=Henningerozyma blattae (strain ATCC 34711 / CBS 6284 / DSM 70876 / NBRC 10599 / NRRL Y-10934 / UCD 77-7) TaxID=1071380 RepID=I2GY36_HENB6|nr:hypothetical protein TBLA_0B01950 [Tetrapisispora blattae CBS 6284]CCH59038.1 hypothetical protein TBLA_0B01950 [Tetrapisispora blattae CBS 6284]